MITPKLITKTIPFILDETVQLNSEEIRVAKHFVDHREFETYDAQWNHKHRHEIQGNIKDPNG